MKLLRELHDMLSEQNKFGEEQKLKLKKQEQEQKELKEKIWAALKEIYVFPGSKSEFEDFIGYQTSWVDLGSKVKGLMFDGEVNNNPFHFYKLDFQKRIADSGVVALVNANSAYSQAYMRDSNWYYFGMPVKRK